MRFKNDGPVTLYVIVDTQYGNVMATYTNLRTARWWLTNTTERLLHPERYKLLKYDQRGTR